MSDENGSDNITKNLMAKEIIANSYSNVKSFAEKIYDESDTKEAIFLLFSIIFVVVSIFSLSMLAICGWLFSVLILVWKVRIRIVQSEKLAKDI